MTLFYYSRSLNLIITVFFAIMFSCSCSTKGSATELPLVPDASFDDSMSIAINRDEKFQSIDGFGFFGAQTVWWESKTSLLYSSEWASQVINDLGISIWRNEYYPPSTASQAQDADWEKQLPVVKGLAETAKHSNVPLKFIFTVWSPPADLKCALSEDNQPLSGNVHTPGTKKGGTLDPAKYTAFGNWLVDGIQLYKDAGVDVYAFSPQNEPLFKQDFNSCYYNPVKWYGEMLKNSMPVVKARFPDVRIFGSENMLEMEGGDDRQYFYGKNIVSDPSTLNNLDIWAVHGYQEGITPTAGSKLVSLWNNFNTEYVKETSKPVWMTETSGYTDEWITNSGKAGALDLACDIQSALINGKVSAWIWWQGSNEDIDDYSLMGGLKKGKKYYASKQFYRFIRPGSRMVKASPNTSGDVSVSAFENAQMGTFTIVLVNPSSKNLKVKLAGQNAPAEYDYYITDSSKNGNCLKSDKKIGLDAVTLPASSVVTLVNGNVYE